MSDILKTIKEDFLQARKNREHSVSSFLSSLVGDIETAAVTAEGRVEITDAMVVKVLKSYEKKAKEFLDIENLAANMLANIHFEMEIINKYMPVQLTEEKIRSIFSELDTSNLGVMMKHLKDNFEGLYDGSLASKIAKEFL